MKSWQVCAYLHRQQKENGGIYMKYRLGAVLLSAAIVTSLAGCQETPDEEIVRQKTDIEQAETVAQDEFENVKKQVAAPDEYKASLEDPTGSLKVTVDAPVTVPDVQGIKLMTVKARTYTQAAAGCNLAAGKGAEFEICHSGLGVWIKNTQSHKMPNTVC